MTEQEAEALVVRLTQVWRPVSPFTIRFAHDYLPSNMWIVKGALTSEFELEVHTKDSECENLPFISLHHHRNTPGSRSPVLFTFVKSNCTIVRIHISPVDGIDRWAAEQWLPFFRRNCWLSGLPLEASAHEKVEWTRDFAKDEMEAYPSIEILPPVSVREKDWIPEPPFMSDEEVKLQARRFAVACGCKPDDSIHFFRLGTIRPGAEFYYDESQNKRGVIIFLKDKPPHMEVQQEDSYLRTEPRGEKHHWHPLSPDVARILFRLGHDPAYIEQHFASIPAQEQLGLKLSMPREFWPKTWLDEERK